MSCEELEIVWNSIKAEARTLADCEPMLASFYHATLLKHENLGSALSYMLATRLSSPVVPAIAIREVVEEAYAADCADRRAAAVAEFTATRTGFTAKTAYDTDALVFFSVPYDDGFTATVNGEPAAIEKVDNGLMAVYVPAGENEIEFTYHTPGLKVSACVSAAAIAVYGVYWLVIIRKRRSRPGSKR